MIIVIITAVIIIFIIVLYIHIYSEDKIEYRISASVIVKVKNCKS